VFNKAEFRANVIKAGFTLETLAKEIGINPATLHRKMNGESDFTRKEIQEISNLLNLNITNINEIFFAEQLT
jgi:transcriptional regulator with XRE-family HTH domain